nr:RNA-binding protein [Bacteriovorax sp. HI3]
MTKKLFVGNLNFSTTSDNLINAFSDFGNVQEVKVIIDNMTNRSRGFAFINMETESEAQRAISHLNGSELDGRSIVVSVAKELAPRTTSFSKKW